MIADSLKNDAATALLIGQSDVMIHIRALIRRVAISRIPVLVMGPTGSGKELAATAIHLESRRRGKFVAFNVCAVAETMFEDALFGHRRGAFTGASSDSNGYLTEADHGTVFLDEISGLAFGAQAKLLRAIEMQTYRAIGASRDTRSDFRVIAASNVDLAALANSGKFREDLYYRLAGMTIRMPALNTRREDIPLLVHAFLNNDGHSSGRTITNDALETLIRADWPGNVRQLKHVIELAATLSEHAQVRVEAVRSALEMPASESTREVRYSDKERQLLVVMEQAQGSVPRAAGRLGVHRATIYRMLARMQSGKSAPRD